MKNCTEASILDWNIQIFLSLNQNRVEVKSMLDETVLGEEPLYMKQENPDES